jgi:choline kinase
MTGTQFWVFGNCSAMASLTRTALHVHGKAELAKATEALRAARRALKEARVLHNRRDLGSVAAAPPPATSGSGEVVEDPVEDPAVLLVATASARVEDLRHRKLKARNALAAQLLPVFSAVIARSAPEFASYARADLVPEDLWVTTISGAMTNTIYKVELTERVVAEGREGDETFGGREGKASDVQGDTSRTAAAVLVRLYGEGTESFFHRGREIEVFNKIGRLNYGSHALLCEFENGRCEKFFEGSVPLEPGVMRTLPVVRQLGAEMKVFHQLDMGPPPSCADAVSSFMETVKSCFDEVRQRSAETWRETCSSSSSSCSSSSSSVSDVAARPRSQSSVGSSISDQVALKTVRELPALIDRVERLLLQRTNDVVVFGHNDLQPGNILVGQDKSLTFIDFEYARFMPRGYDLANQWCEWAADYLSDTPHVMDYSKGPTEQQKLAFARSYLEANVAAGADAVSENDVRDFVDEEIQAYLPLTHLWWGVWGLLQVSNNMKKAGGDNEGEEGEAFDYLGYAMCRIDALKACCA